MPVDVLLILDKPNLTDEDDIYLNIPVYAQQAQSVNKSQTDFT